MSAHEWPPKSRRWRYTFDAPGSTREKRIRIQKGGFRSKASAIAAEAIARAEMFRSPGEPSGITLGQLLDEYLAHCAGRVRATSLRTYTDRVAMIDETLLAIPARDVKAQIWAGEWARLRSTLASGTVAGVASLVSGAYRWAVDADRLQRNPILSSRPPGPSKPRQVAYSITEVDKLASSATAWLGAIIRLAAASGARRGELLALEWGDLSGDCLTIERAIVYVKRKICVVPTKTELIHTVTLPSGVVSVIERWRLELAHETEIFGDSWTSMLMFPRLDTGGHRNPMTLSNEFTRLARRLGLPGSFHALRHTMASHALAAGVELPVVSKRLGHSSVATTARTYAHALSDRDRAAAIAMQAFADREREATERWEGRLM